MTSKIHASMTVSEWFMLLTLSLLWGGSFFFVGVLVDELPPLTIVVLRVGLAAVVLHLYLLFKGNPISGGIRVWATFFAMGLLNNAIPFSLIVWGQTHIASGLASILNATTPIFTVVVAHVLTQDERLTPARLGGVVAGFAGVAVLMGPQFLSGLGEHVLAQAAILGAALSYACAGVFGRRFKAMGVKPLHTATGQVTGSAILLLPVALVVDKPWTLSVPSGYAIAALLGLAVVSTALAYVLYFRILATAGATNVLLVTLLVPVSAIVLGVVVLGESIALQSLLGMALIALGLGVIDGRPFRLMKRAPG